MSRRIRWDAVNAVVAYVDTVWCLIRYPLPEDDLYQRLHSTGAGKIIPDKPRQIGGELYQPLRIHQPTRGTITVLAGLSKCVICRLDVAIDFICRSKRRALLVGSYFDRFLIQKWHGGRRKNRHKNSIYWSKKIWTARNIDVYADKPSKTGMGPCTHVELRFFGASACRLVGVSTPHRLLQKVDVLRLLRHQTRLALINQRRFDRLTERVARDHLRRRVTRRRSSSTGIPKIIWDQFNTVDGLHRRTSGLYCRILQAEGKQEPTKINAQELIERLPKMHRCLTPIPWKHVCPNPQWMLLP